MSASTTPEHRFLLLAGTVATARGAVHLTEGDRIPADADPEDVARLERLGAIGVPTPKGPGEPYAAIDIFTTNPHYFDHVASVAGRLNLPVQVPAGLAAKLEGRGPHLLPFEGQKPHRLQPVALVMGPADIRDAVRHGWEHIAYLCHGIGQDYNQLLAAATPGENIPWDQVECVLLPSPFAAERFAQLCPQAEKIVVGQPKLDRLQAIPIPEGTTAALSFRWDHARAPEAKGAFDHYRASLGQIAAYAADHGVELIGHGHPRIFNELVPDYMAAGIEPVRDFADVVKRAKVYVCDNSSTLFEFAALERPVVVMNAPWYRRDVDHGGRFWDWADVGEQVDGPDELGPAIVRAFDDRTGQRRREIVEQVFPLADGNSTERAAAALVARYPSMIETQVQTRQAGGGAVANFTV